MKSIKPKTVGGGKSHPPRSFHSPGALCLIFLVFIPILTGCQADGPVTLAFMGDISLGRDVAPDLDSFSYLEDRLSTAGLVLANLESPFGDGTGVTTTGYNLCAPTELAALLMEWGIDILSLANNHSNDCSPIGIGESQSTLSAVGLVGLTSQSYHINLQGIDITFFAFDDVASELDLESAAGSISAAHTDNSLVIISMHWGMEYQGAPSDRQKYIARVLAEAGADIIWGHHPHVLQPVEWIKTYRGNSLVFYSLGNALFDQGGLKDTRQSALLLVDIGIMGVESIEAVPFEIDVPHSILKAPAEDDSLEIVSILAIPTNLSRSR